MDDVTRLVGEAATVAAASPFGAVEPAGNWGRFTPGTLFAGRFRIVAPLGRGGMGEVYRADDLRLGQTVALKLLPDALAGDPARLAQFHNEVRVARTIAHRNVCRTYDIGDADGRPFITMEYVDGEDLASLLRRIGRLPEDKAVQVARQICAGLAAAHERGVLHRDLKPANVMIDGEGHVRLTDFGLAAVGAVENVRAGTPAYMAPEQLAGREVTQRSDIYALGLVLFELFTGRRAFEAATLNDLISEHESGSIAAPSTLVRDLDPTIERAILRCLDPVPAKRPASALAVSAALPGGDQLAAAIAAGETPSPEMVAAAGEQSAVKPAVGVSLVAFTVAILALLTIASDRFAFVNQIPLPRSTDSLRDRAQEMLERFGYRDAPADSAAGWEFSRQYVNFARAQSIDPRAAVGTGRTGTATFWYRTSPARLVSATDNVQPTPGDPPLILSGMRLVRLDAHGRLLELHSIPPQVEGAGPAAEPAGPPDWAPLFEAAALERSAFHETAPLWTPRGISDRRVAWEGPLPDLPSVTIRVEAASYRGRPAMFLVVFPWTVPGRMVPPSASSRAQIISTLAAAVTVTILLAAAALARRNLRTGRGDRRGSFRTSAVLFVCLAFAWVLRMRHYSALELEWNRVAAYLGLALYLAATIWLSYVALEPYVRRFWPQLLIGWTRLLSGRIRDPLVGRDVLVGVAAGGIGALLIASRELVPRAFGWTLATPQLPSANILLGTRHVLSIGLQTIRPALLDAMQCMCVLVLLRIVLRRTWLVLAAGTIVMLPVAMSGTFAGEQLVLEVVIALLGVAVVFTTLLRFGFLALVAMFFTFLSTETLPLTLDASRPYFGASLTLLATIVGLSAFGFYASRGDEPLLGSDLLD